MKRPRGPRIVRRKAIHSETDPYQPDEGLHDTQECRRCGSIYYEKRWILGSEAGNIPGVRPFALTVCPACRKTVEKYPEGFVTIQGDFVAGHREEIVRLIRNKERIAMHFNPLDRIIDIKETGGRLEVTTTTEKLAERIGQILKKAFQGTVEYKWSEDVLARVVWTRSETES